ncbi:MAG TPA: acyloxyacyl hydrolase [Xanthomonadaceae bacterium]|nr:acyloxyacyl hydrolase [Xanthomonadaceae bacterium]
MPMRLLTLLLAGSLAGSLASPVLAGERGQFRIGAGPAEELDDEWSHVVQVSWLTASRHPWEFGLGYIGQRDPDGRAQVPDAFYLSVSKRLTWRGWFLSSGVAWVDEDNDVLSGHGQFLTGIGYEFGRWAISVRHLSNASTGGRNRGETFALVEVGF